MDKTKALKWLEEATSPDSNRTVSAKVGIDQSSLAGRRKTGNITHADVIAIARAYGKPVVPALVDAGFLTHEEAFESNMISTLAQATDDQMADEIMRRFKAGQASKVLTD